MKLKNSIQFLLAVVLSVAFSSFAMAQIPRTMNYQGILTTQEGVPVSDGTYSLTFRLYDISEGGAEIWEETQNITVEKGVFNTLLGKNSPITAPFDTQYWLGIAIDGGEELSPRVKLASSPYSFMSLESKNVSNESITANKIAPGQVVKSLNTLTDNVNLLAGANVTITPGGGNSLVIAAAGGGGGGGGTTQNIEIPLILIDSVNHSDKADSAIIWVENHGNGYGMYSYGKDGIIAETSDTIFGNLKNFSAAITGYGNDGISMGLLGNNNWAVYGSNNNNLLGAATYGYIGSDKYAVFGKNSVFGNFGYIGSDSLGVYGEVSNYFAQAIRGENSKTGNYGYFGSGDYGAVGAYRNFDGSYNMGYLGSSHSGVSGVTFSNNMFASGVSGESKLGVGVVGISETGTGVRAVSQYIGVHSVVDSSGRAIVATNFAVDNQVELARDGYGIHCYTNQMGATGIYVNAYGGNGQAALFEGDVRVTGTLSKGGGSFTIDHPLDPANKYLSHSFVESPDMMNVYNGNVVLDKDGEAVVEMPRWFEALNRDFRYQLTCIGGFAPVYVAEEIDNNSFKIAGGTPGVKISWQVTGIRKDPYANAHRIPVEEKKGPDEKGKYLYPEEYGQPEEMGIYYEERENAREKLARNHD